MSWNIQDYKGDGSDKFQNCDFIKILEQGSIICLQETKKQIKVEGYISFNSNRKDSRSGGVCIMAENRLRKGVSFVHCNESEDIIAVKLDRNFFKFEFDLFLVCFYISPPNSSYAKKIPDYTENTFAALNTVCARLRQKGEVAMCGDSNARTGIIPDYVSSCNAGALHDIYQEIGLPVDSEEPRNNSDPTVVEPHSQLFIDTVINNQLKILNGRTLGDTTGKLTCHKSNGSSLVDYFVISSWAREHVDSLQVKEFTSFSDHCPIVLNLTTFEPLEPAFTLPDFANMPAGFKWDATHSHVQFKAALNSNAISEQLTEIVNSDLPTTSEGNSQINKRMVECLQSAGRTALKVKKTPQFPAHKKWFDFQCRLSKRNLGRLANRLGNNHCNSALRKEYFTQRNKHSNIVNKKRNAFLFNLNKAIEDGHVLDWKKFKRLKQENDSSPLLDKFDLASFHRFFSNLYSKPSHSLDLTQHTQKVQDTPPDLDILNKPITHLELSKCIKKLKKGKSCSTDLILNEMLQSMTPLCTKAVLKTFNHSLQSGLYPWHTSVITPIYKSGNPFSPDNYRAIAVGSCLGKLFSSILLDRMIEFKNAYCPDPKEQLGFSKGAQTNDHILTLKTLVDKYTKNKKVKLYACFVDLKKAFDTVCRDLLLHKIACLGISGNFFNCLSDMYKNSIACIKISKLLSPDINIGKGTEQGHPLSPDLFKLYIRELSSNLKSVGDYPELADLIISHLLWADDLVLLALSPKALQDNINILLKFCQLMGLEINIDKTKIVTFHPARSKSYPEQFFLGNQLIKNTDKYCYLGIIFHSNGSFAAANTELRAKAMRALYGLKGGIIKDALSPRSLFILFDSLIKPILLYGCQVLTPHSKTIKYLLKLSDQSDPTQVLKYLAQDHYEKFHMKFLKYSLSVHSKSSNIGCWGETGRHPLIFEACKLAIDYYTRVENSDNPVISAAFHEQVTLGLDWFSNICNLIEKYKGMSPSNSNAKLSTLIAHHMRGDFVEKWKSAKRVSPKLEFYNSLKNEFGPEKYLNLVKCPDARKSLTRLRISAHNLYIERGRYETPLVPRADRWCVYCKLNLGIVATEDEFHALAQCPLYTQVRNKFKFHPKDPSELAGLLSNQNLTTVQATAVAKTVHAILTTNLHYTDYYKNGDIQNCGSCIIL